MAVYKRGDVWWYKFTWRGKPIRESTKQGNKRIAEQIESARKTELAKGEVGIKDKAVVPTLKEFAEREFLPFVESRFSEKPKTLAYYRNGIKNILSHVPLATCTLETVAIDKIAGFINKRKERGLQVASINRELQVLRRMLKIAIEWGKVQKAMPKVAMLPGERHRERVLNEREETQYLQAAEIIGERLIEAYQRALAGIRAVARGEEPMKPEDPFLLRDVTTLLIDCGLRPEECFRLRWDEILEDSLNICFGKTANARRIIPLSERALAIIEMRRQPVRSGWVFAAPTRSGHVEHSTLKKQHAKACGLGKVAPFTFYTFRHSCLTRWAEYMDPYTLAYLAGHSDFGTTRRYVHPQAGTIRAAMERARAGQGWAQNWAHH